MLTFLRWVVVMVVLWPIYGGQVREHWPQIRPRLPGIVVLASLGFTGFNALYYVAAHYTTAINIGILQGSMPIFVLAGAFIAHGTRATLVQLAGVLVTAVGVVVVATRGEPLAILEVELNKGDLAMLAACALYAFYTVGAARPPGHAGNGLLHVAGAHRRRDIAAARRVRGAHQRLQDADRERIADHRLGRDLPVVPFADLLSARRRSDRTGARRACSSTSFRCSPRPSPSG